MLNLIRQAAALGIRNRVIWLDKFVATEELLTLFQCTSVFLTPFDEITPTSVRLLPLQMASLAHTKIECGVSKSLHNVFLVTRFPEEAGTFMPLGIHGK